MKSPVLMRLRRLAVLVWLGGIAVLFVSCATAEVGGAGDAPDSGPQICLLHNCTSDVECANCTFARVVCLPDRNRCVACDEKMGLSCEGGERCSEFGQCIPSDLECPTDEHGQPMVACVDNEDCAACDPQHRICNVEEGVCVACTPEDTSECPTNALCVAGACAQQCPKVCEVDADCSACGANGSEARACNAHKCAECSPTLPCPSGRTCTPNGTCVTPCGTDSLGACAAPGDCVGCIEGVSTCHVSGGAGACGVMVGGCDALAADPPLPDPWAAGTAVCSTTTTTDECAGKSASLNIGAILRDRTGEVDIKDATVPYDMNACGTIVTGGGDPPATCGLCVPCVTDADCMDINVDPIAEQAFGPAGSPEAAYLIDRVFGSNDHMVRMYCDKIGGTYGVCSVCPGIIYECRVGGGTGGGTCDHDVCTAGGPLKADCDACTAAVCEVDNYCCTTWWDGQCVSEVDSYCGMSCGVPGGCPHSECDVGAQLDATCSICAEAVCKVDAYCCTTSWDATCVSEVEANCGMACAPTPCSTPSDCPWPLGCRTDHTCGKCESDVDCAPDKCDTFYGECT